MTDTPPHIEARLREIFLNKTPEERLNLGCSMYGFSKTLVRSALLRENPDLSPAQLRAELFRRFYCDDFDKAELERLAGIIAGRLPHGATIPAT